MKKLFWMVAAMLVCSVALAEQVYYVNPEGGVKYHAVRDCPSISAKYHANMVEVPASELNSNVYAVLTECAICKVAGNVQEAASESDFSAVLPGEYVVGVDIPQGLYMFQGEEDRSTLIILKWDGTPWESYDGSDWSEVVHL